MAGSLKDFTSDKGLKLGLASGQIGLVLTGVIAKLQTVFAGAAKAIREALGPRPCSIVNGLATDLLRSRAELAVENVLLRQQLIVAARKVKRPILRRHDVHDPLGVDVRLIGDFGNQFPWSAYSNDALIL